MGQKQKRIRQKEQQDLAEEQMRTDIEKWDQTKSPEIPDRGRHQKFTATLLGIADRKMESNDRPDSNIPDRGEDIRRVWPPFGPKNRAV